MSFQLRPYQEEAVQKVLWEKRASLDGNSVIVIPTGGGKSLILSEIAHRLNEPILILQPTREILVQNLDKLLHYMERSDIGIYSAAMSEKTIGKITLATIGSIYKKPEFFKHFKLIIIDEAHLVRPANLGGMFNSFLKAIGTPKVIGLTATPFRLDTKYIPEQNGMFRAVTTTKIITRMKGMFWKRMLYCMSIADLMNQKYLCPLEYIDRSLVSHEGLKLNKSESDFDLDAFEENVSDKQDRIIEAIEYGQNNSKSVLVFCSSVEQAEDLSTTFEGSAVVSAKTPKKEREKIIEGFKNGTIKTVFNVQVLTVGFDHPALDCIVLLRPTRSIGLLMQMIGRGVRIAPGKTSCKVIDITGTIKSVGRIETIKMVKREKWELESETGSWHNTPLYDYVFQRKEKPVHTVDSVLTELFLEKNY